MADVINISLTSTLGDLVSDQSKAPSELALGSSPSQAAGTMDSYLLVVSGVNPRRGDQIESAVVVRSGPVREATAPPHQNQGTTGYENHPTSFLLDSHSGPAAGLALPVKVVSP
ncbi:hypothetical protein N7494_005374 [Penicillium frequentans]|uniref:Uncharacterized protein n=1 Tax=Penicillium frequentans TaxID=3151616 RepID=A0AAD6GG30_9EURO|nr:hypothetical protein N7494_005374 [Penicillium glabrum]